MSPHGHAHRGPTAVRGGAQGAPEPRTVLPCVHRQRHSAHAARAGARTWGARAPHSDIGGITKPPLPGLTGSTGPPRAGVRHATVARGDGGERRGGAAVDRGGPWRPTPPCVGAGATSQRRNRGHRQHLRDGICIARPSRPRCVGRPGAVCRCARIHVRLYVAINPFLTRSGLQVHGSPPHTRPVHPAPGRHCPASCSGCHSCEQSLGADSQLLDTMHPWHAHGNECCLDPRPHRGSR